jgi:hypothetical protein
MSLLLRETEANFNTFDSDWRLDEAAVATQLAKERTQFLSSYRRIVSLQAWRVFLEPRISESSLAFFLESQNDALTSHVFANLGSWRSSLKALRSCIENVMFCLYYKDHSVELKLWMNGKHKLPIADFITYFEQHPQRVTVAQVDSMPRIQAEYSTLSKAVHASARGFRMTKDIKTTLLWSDSAASLGAWQSRESAVLTSLNLLLLAHYHDELLGSAESSLREAISLAIAASLYPDIKSHLGVILREP